MPVNLSTVPEINLGGQDVIVVSDLHMGDGGKRDNFSQKRNRERDWDSFLGHVEGRQARLVIVGDLFEFWQCNLSKVIVKREALLDRLLRLDAVYVLGNHDNDLISFVGHAGMAHPFFGKINDGFTAKLGGKTFRFLHGHETDPWNSSPDPSKGRMAAIFAGMAEDEFGGAYLANGKPVEGGLEEGANLAQGLLAKILDWIKGLFGVRPSAAEGLTPAQHPTRYQDQLQQMAELHGQAGDHILIVGHTHRPGHMGNWYWNSGSWAEDDNDFLEIRQDGTIKGFRWLDGRAEPKDAEIPMT
jgi:UDP-2,3-diacylglucosamine pyrophosphatase LpxH